ncbi:MAG: biotin/lipoate A/B protein ligase family protein [Firmicutes bacterium]|nr:biotin/lipoate A/B protein ligase family protein [Bacillota bacterium]
MWSFRVIDTGVADAALNMGLDEAILLHVAAHSVPPTIRFYGWSRPTVSLGYFQRARKEIDEEAIRARDYRLVRRMTGGRAVLHDRELTYSVIVPGDHPLAESSVIESYRLLSQGLRDGFLNLGVEAKLVSLADEDEKAKYESSGSAACFDSPSWYELVVGGKKIAGSAQVRAHGGLLQHGALLLDLDADDLFSLLRFRSEEDRARLRTDFDERAVSVRQLTGREVTYQEAAAAFTSGFATGLPAILHPGSITPEEMSRAEDLAQSKYADDTWTFRR